MQEEKDLIEQQMSGDSESFAGLYDAYAPHLYRYISFRIDHRQDAEDVVSEVFLKSFETIRAGKKVRMMRAFLYQAARNAIADYFRHKARRLTHELFLDECVEQTVLPTSISSIDTLFDLARVKKGLKRLKPEYQEVIILRYVEDLGIDEIAIAIDKSQVSVRVLLHRALRTLKRHVIK